MAEPQPRDERGEGDLGGIAAAAEHAFAEEGAAERDAVDAADQRFAFPNFDRMGRAALMERDHGLFDRAVDPGLGPVSAAQQDAAEVAVGGDGVAARAEPPGEASREVEAVEWDDRAVAGLDPEELVAIAAVSHRKDAARIAAKEKVEVEQRAHAPW
ncbi:hypothetical protein GCM10022281_14750 [Sphingomonas rosea]|uniref:Uncharacterized protein n=1 Tax=Sphingomonas rosea TaxID=335605 RepID=A0ABP7U414_9SPHN